MNNLNSAECVAAGKLRTINVHLGLIAILASHIQIICHFSELLSRSSAINLNQDWGASLITMQIVAAVISVK